MQYKKIISEMTYNESNIEHRKEIIEVIASSKKNMAAAKQLFENYKHVKWHTVQNFWVELYTSLEKNGFKPLNHVDDGTITEITHYENYKRGQKAKQECGIGFELKNGINVVIGYNPRDLLYFGSEIKLNNVEIEEQIKNILSNKISEHFNEGLGWIFWKTILQEEKQINFIDFERKATFDLIDKNYRGQIIAEIIIEIKRFTNHIELIQA